jgi:hypothetical protein
MSKTKYAVRLNDKKGGKPRYITWCDECWYETSKSLNHKFSHDEAEKICEQMASHYQNNLTILGSDGSVEERGSKNPNVKPVEKPVTAKKSLFSINLSTFKMK